MNPSQAIPRKLINKVMIVKLGKVTASDIRMHRVLISLTLTFTQGHTDQNLDNNKCSIISETIQRNPQQVCSNAGPVKSQYDHCQFVDLALHLRSQLKCVSNVTTF